MFTGVGGFELGIQQAHNIKQSNEDWSKTRDENERGHRSFIEPEVRLYLERNKPPLCVGVCEWDKYSSIVLQKRLRGVKNYGDATKINTDELPDFDLLVGGFPCQAFSIAGKRRGFEDTRGTMFFEIARVLKAKRPEYFVLENVKGLLSHDKGKTFLTIISTLQELGYNVEWGVVNSRYFGVPQNRERVFIIGCLRERGRSKVFPLSRTNRESTCEYREEYKISNRSPREAKWQDNSPCMAARDYKDPKVVLDYQKIRKLTPRECERLQGFPDDWTLVELPNGKLMSDTQRYKQMGNAVTVNVVQAIMENLIGEYR